jgi:hypothetical protein
MSKKNTETKKLKSADGTIAFYVEGKMHNWDGPAFIPKGEEKKGEYYLFGIKMSKDEWLEKKKSFNGQPFHKTAAGKASGARV